MGHKLNFFLTIQQKEGIKDYFVTKQIDKPFMDWVTDYFTSRATKKLWEKEEVRKFFMVIGLDQAIHITTLFLTYHWLVK